MRRIGLTGGIGCGKSTVVAELRRQGVPCFVADEVAEQFNANEFIPFPRDHYEEGPLNPYLNNTTEDALGLA